MSSKSKEGTKPETADYVDALSAAIMRILKYSNNDIFVSKCFSSLKVNTPIQARTEIQKCFQKVIGFNTSSKGPETNLHQRSAHRSEISGINVCEPFNETDVNSTCASNFFPHPVDETFDDPTFHYHSEQHIPGLQNHHDVGQFSDDSIVDLANERHSSRCLTSTPYENVRQLAGVSSENNLTFRQGRSVDLEDELEVLRCDDHDEFYNDEVEDIDEEIESSYGSINFSMPDITEPTASSYSVNFSHPEYLNESYLLRDLTDFLGQSDEMVDVNLTPDMTEDLNNGISSQELVDKALLSISKSLLADDMQGDSQPTIIINHEEQMMFKDHTDCIQDTSSNLNLHKNYVIGQKQNSKLSESVQNFDEEESDCIIVYDTSQNKVITQETANNNSTRKLESNNVDLIITNKFSKDDTGPEESENRNKFDSKSEKLSTEEKLISSLEDSSEKYVENFDDAGDMETQYECYFDSGTFDFEVSLDEKSTEDEGTDDDEESNRSDKNEELFIKNNSNFDHLITVTDDKCICSAVGEEQN